MIEAILFLIAWLIGAIWGINFQKNEDKHIIEKQKICLNHDKVVIDNLNKRLGENDE